MFETVRGYIKGNSVPLAVADELERRQEDDLKELIPVVSPLVGALILLLSAWDYLVDPGNAYTAFMLRLVAVGLAALCYKPTLLRWTPRQRIFHIYWMHTAGVILASFVLDDGLVLGLGGALTGIIPAAFVVTRFRQYAVLIVPPFALLAACTWFRYSGPELANVIVMYGFGIVIGFVQLCIFRHLRLKSLWLEHQLLELASHDPLTGCSNRNRLREITAREIGIARREGRSFAIAMLDVDHFKSINDVYGHDAGDEALKALVACCSAHLRNSDYIARLGGEEFICLLPDTEQEDALRCAERLREAVAALSVSTSKGEIQFTISIGVAIFGEQHDKWETLLKDADEALYLAKHQGRNRVVLAQTTDNTHQHIITKRSA